MEKLKVSEVIVVEGIHDKQKIESCVIADIIVSSGTHISEDFLTLCETMNKTRGIIVFTDPDGPGEMIRRRIIERVGTCKHASLHVYQSKHKQKVGIEHAPCDVIVEALKACAVFDVERKSISRDAFNAFGLSGRLDSQERRDMLSEHFKFPRSNAKRAHQFLNMLGITEEEVSEVLEGGIGNGDNCK